MAIDTPTREQVESLAEKFAKRAKRTSADEVKRRNDEAHAGWEKRQEHRRRFPSQLDNGYPEYAPDPEGVIPGESEFWANAADTLIALQARIADLEAELALRDQLETAGYSINREYNNRETWTARRWGVNQSQHNTADEARAAVRLLEGDAT